MQKAFTIKQPEEVTEVQEIREKLKKLEELEAKTLEAEKAVEADIENADLDKAWGEAYKEEYKQYSEVAKLIAEIVNDKKARTILNNSSVWRGNEQRDRKQTEN